jgi:hypothetical protein
MGHRPSTTRAAQRRIESAEVRELTLHINIARGLQRVRSAPGQHYWGNMARLQQINSCILLRVLASSLDRPNNVQLAAEEHGGGGLRLRLSASRAELQYQAVRLSAQSSSARC